MRSKQRFCLSKHLLKPLRCRLLSLGTDMQRRDFITIIGGAAAAWPLKAHIQQPERMARIGGMLAFGRIEPAEKAFVAALKKGPQDLAGIEGRNIQVEFPWAAAQP